MSQAHHSSRRSGGSSNLLGEILKRKRLEHAMSQQEAADSIGIQRAHLSQIEGGLIRQPSTVLLAKAAEIFSMPATDLYSAAGYMVPDDLPDLRLYLHAKHPDWPDAVALDIEQYCEFVRYKYGLPE